MRLTTLSLICEYDSWKIRFGNGRNLDDCRFGQHIINTYDIVTSNSEIFYEENARVAFDKIFDYLVELN